ncbi:hypothetical protein GCK32_020108 [Trichostrongylus colubriformis]|uniref:ShKT domain-containing protein n=1 Tax=Trichostrongylus colubriformis TaxID=6319 RepID=A0AAN8J1P6_TRICO
MFVHILCTLVLLSAFTAYEYEENDCFDHPTMADFCWDLWRTGGCNVTDIIHMELAKEYCPKTCNLCECRDDPAKPNFCWNMERYDYCNSTEKPSISRKARKYCPKTCRVC